jgi:hypothetical protein
MRKLAIMAAMLFGALAALNAVRADDYYYGVNTPPHTVIIGIDLSLSNPLIDDDAFAAKVAARIGQMIQGLAPHSRVSLRSFGSYDSAANAALTFDTEIAPKTARSEDIARFISAIVAGVPKLVRQGKVRAQSTTNIIAFLDNMAATTDCRAQPATVILASDGIEDSKLANLSRGGGTLPMPDRAVYAGCDQLMILGLAQGVRDPRETERLRDEWAHWAQAAGFRGFTGLNDW